jgi:catechol 2,3-dioxygenase-like lactoylglutathione lyase family enzyme
MFQEGFPILSVSNIEATLAFYRDQLEFGEVYRFPEHGDPVYVGLDSGGSVLELAPTRVFCRKKADRPSWTDPSI